MSLATKATGILAYTDNDATDGRIVTVGSVVYTLKTGALSAPGDVKIAAGNADRTAANLANCVNADGGVPGTDYYSTPRNSRVTALLDAVGNAILFQARTPGAVGNSVALTTNEPEFTVPGTLSGGIDGTAPVPWSLVTLDEAKNALRARNDDADEDIVGLLAEVAAIVEQELDFRPVTDLGTGDPEDDVEEFHDLGNPQGFIYLGRRPLRSVTAVYNAGTLMDSTQYVVDRVAGLITIVGAQVTPIPGFGVLSRRPQSFVSGFPEDAWRFGNTFFQAIQGSVRVLYKGGYASTETVDPALKNVAYDMLARIFRTRERKGQGVVQEVAQGLAIGTKYDLKVMNDDMKSRLAPFRSLSMTVRR